MEMPKTHCRNNEKQNLSKANESTGDVNAGNTGDGSLCWSGSALDACV